MGVAATSELLNLELTYQANDELSSNVPSKKAPNYCACLLVN